MIYVERGFPYLQPKAKSKFLFNTLQGAEGTAVVELPVPKALIVAAFKTMTLCLFIVYELCYLGTISFLK